MTVPARNKILNIIAIIIVTIVAASDLLQYMVPTTSPGLANKILYAETAVMLCITLGLMATRRPWPKAGWLLIFYAVWLVFTRVYHHSLFTDRSELLCAAQMVCGFYIVALIDSESRRHLFVSTAVMVSAVLMYWAFLALYLVFTGKIFLLSYTNIYVTKLQEGTQDGMLRYVCFFDQHRNVASAFFMCALGLIAIAWIAVKNKLCRILMIPVAVLLYVCIALQHSRTVYIAVAAGAALLAALAVMSCVHHWHFVPRTAAWLLAALITLTVTYKGFTATETLLSTVSDLYQTDSVSTEPIQETTLDTFSESNLSTSVSLNSTQYMSEPLKELTNELVEGPMADNRNLLRDLATLTERTAIWQSVFQTIQRYPVILAVGLPKDDIVANMEKYGNLSPELSHAHTHNMILQILMLTGLPGMLAIIILLLILLAYMLRVFFSQGNMFPKLLTAPLAALLLYGMAEPLFDPQTLASSFCFMLFAGGFYSELLQNRAFIGDGYLKK